MSHLDHPALAAYVAGELSAASVLQINAHLEGCDECRRRVDAGLITSAVPGPRVPALTGIRAGTRLGRYEILARIGGGGMGEVFRARDERIGRDVAVKVISGATAQAPDLLRRFELEARAAGALNHPHVLAIHDVGNQDGTPYLVTELLEGENLRAALRRGRMPPARAVELARQICRGLGAAHAKGIVHRDLKPENLFLLAADGRLKILDFGLAKLIGPTETAADQTAAVLGTAGYVAPEVLRNAPADPRADLFAVGVILYEMLTGERAFKGASPVEAHHAALTWEPPLSELPPALAPVLRRCLEKDPEARFQSAADLELALSRPDDTPPPARERRRPTGLLAAGAAAVALAVTAAVLIGREPPRPAAPAAVRAFLLPPAGHTFDTIGDFAGTVEVSPDGALLAFMATDGEGVRRIWVRAIDGVDARPLPGTEDAIFPFWSPDSRSLGFFTFMKQKLFRVDLSGGAPTALADAHDGRGGAWSASGEIIFAPDWRTGLQRVSATGGPSAPLTQVDARLHTTHRWPLFLPDGRRFLFFAGNHDASRKAEGGIYLASLDGDAPVRVIATGSQAALADGHLLYRRDDGALAARRFDLERGTLDGAERFLAEDIRYDPSAFVAVFSAGGNVVAYQTGGVRPRETRLVWFDREGRRLGELASRNVFGNLALSPDGRSLAACVGDPGDVWIYDVARAVGTRFTFTPVATEGTPVWSPDGTELGYTAETVEPAEKDAGLPDWQIVVRPIGGGAERRIPPTAADNQPLDWSPDGRWLLVSSWSPATGLDVSLVSTRGEPVVPLFASSFSETGARVSKDGRWVAYVSDEAGRPEVYVTQFPRPSGKWRVSEAGGAFPHWRADGREIFYVSARSRLMAVSLAPSAAGLEVGAPQPVVPGVTLIPDESSPYDVSADGQRFIVNVADEERAAPVTLLVGWTAAVTP